EGVRHVDQRARHEAYRVGGHQRVEEDGTDEQDRHLRRLTDPEPDDEQRDERARRQVPQQPDDRLQQRLSRREAAHQDPQRYGDGHRQPEPGEYPVYARPRIGGQRSGLGHVPPGRPHRLRRRQERRGHRTAGRQRVPRQQRQRHGQRGQYPRGPRADRAADREQPTVPGYRPAPGQRRPVLATGAARVAPADVGVDLVVDLG